MVKCKTCGHYEYCHTNGYCSWGKEGKVLCDCTKFIPDDTI